MGQTWVIEKYCQQCSVDELWNFTEENLKNGATSYPMYWTTRGRIERMREKGEIFLAMAGKNMIGCIMVEKGNVEVLCIKRRYRRKGVGTSLLRHMENELKKKRYKTLRVISMKAFGAKGFYEKQGYEIESKRQFFCDRTWHLKKAIQNEPEL